MKGSAEGGRKGAGGVSLRIGRDKESPRAAAKRAWQFLMPRTDPWPQMYSARRKWKTCSARWRPAASAALPRAAATVEHDPAAAKHREKVTPYDFKRPERVGKEQMRALANAARGLRPQLRRRPVGPAAEHRRGEAHQRRSAHLQRVRLQPGKPHLLQPPEGRAAGRQPDPRRQPLDPLSDHRPPAGRRPRGRSLGPPAADGNRAAAGVADHRAVSRTNSATPGRTSSS